MIKITKKDNIFLIVMFGYVLFCFVRKHLEEVNMMKKKRIWAAVILVFALMLSACSNKNETKAETKEETKQETAAESKQETQSEDVYKRQHLYHI